MSDLLDAATDGNVDKVKQLLPGCKDINYIDECGYSALHYASENGHTAVVKALLEAEANINQITFHTEFTALHFAISKNHWESAKLLIDGGADLNAINQAGCCGTPLHLAVSKANVDITKEIVKKGADVDAISEQGYTPLLLAVSTNLEEIALILLLTGSDPNITDYDDKTPLHEAAYNGYGKMVKMLVDNKADVTLKDGKGQTAQDMAEKTKEEDIAKFLKACAAGNIPADAPSGRVKEERVFRIIEPVEGCGEGCAMLE